MSDQPEQLPQHDPELVKVFFEQQAKEIELNEKRVHLQMMELDANSKHADKALSLQAEDRKDQRAHEKVQNKQSIIFLCFIAIIFLVGGCYALYLGKDGLIKDIVQIAAVVIGTAIGGYGVGYMKGQAAERERSNSSDQ